MLNNFQKNPAVFLKNMDKAHLLFFEQCVFIQREIGETSSYYTVNKTTSHDRQLSVPITIRHRALCLGFIYMEHKKITVGILTG